MYDVKAKKRDYYWALVRYKDSIRSVIIYEVVLDTLHYFVRSNRDDPRRHSISTK